MEYATLFAEIKKQIKKPLEDFTTEFAVQCNVTGEGEGIFYIAFKCGIFEVAPYDYLDRDAALTAEGSTYLEIFSGKISFKDAMSSGKLTVDGDQNSILQLEKLTKSYKEPTVKKPAFQKAPKKVKK